MSALPNAREALRRHFGYAEFRPGQVDVVTSVLDGRDTLAVLPTGGGKSLCYQVPALLLPRLTIVISPLISLMKDQVDRLVQRGIRAAFLNSTLAPAEATRCLNAVGSGHVKLLYLSPERLAAPDIHAFVERCGLSLVAVDEAHCISEWGHDFRPGFRRLAQVIARYGEPQVVALTATATPAVRRDIVAQLRMRSPRVIVGGFDRTNLHYAVRQCRTAEAKMPELLDILRSHARPAVVYAATRGSVEMIARTLKRCGYRALPYHAGLDESRRQDSQDAFMRGQVEIMVATNAFGMGVDKPDVRLVVHHLMPRTLESYYQEAGRAGRDGQPARCVLLHADEDRLTHEWFIDTTFPDRSEVAAAWARLRASGAAPAGVDAATAFLIRHGVAIERRSAGRRVRVSLVAAPDRIRRSFRAQADPEALHTLRVLWRQGCLARGWGRDVDLGTLSSAIPWRRALAALERLRDRSLVVFVPVDGGISLASPQTALEAAPIDWAAIARRRESELGKSAAVQRYARSNACRRAVVLAYFGEQPRAANCGGCDNCDQSWISRAFARIGRVRPAEASRVKAGSTRSS